MAHDRAAAAPTRRPGCRTALYPAYSDPLWLRAALPGTGQAIGRAYLPDLTSQAPTRPEHRTFR